MVGASNKVLSQQSSMISSFNKLGKRKNYTNFSKSGLPQRIFYYHDSEWIDYPQYIVESVRDHFQLQIAAIEVNFDGCDLVLDTLYMIQVELKTGLQTDIAWIDESGCCFFPEFYFIDEEICECCESELEDYPTVEDCDSCNQNSNAETPGVIAGRTPDFSMHDIVDADTVQNMFLMSLSSFVNIDIFDVNSCSSHFSQTRSGLFQKQVELMKKNRGDANVQYAWMAATKDALSSMMIYGLGHVGPKITSSYGIGIGVHLTPLNCDPLSESYWNDASYWDDNENGLRYFVFCRVILGNMEVVKPGQWYPSSEKFDSGVDDLRYPCRYIVWNMNMNTHISPEYVISFQTSSGAEGAVVGKESRIGVSGITTSQEPQDQLQLDCSPVESSSKENTIRPGSGSQKPPSSPWLPLPMLLEAIAKKVAPKYMGLVNVHYHLHTNGKLSREEFIRKLRSIVGDTLLGSTVMNLQPKLRRILIHQTM